jgi:hypothetical protein
MYRPNIWDPEGRYYMARDEYGMLTIIGSQEARDKWAVEYKDLLELDEREPIVQTGKNQDLVLTLEGRLYEKRGDPLVYREVTELVDAVALHHDHSYRVDEWVVELADGSFYKQESTTKEWAKREFKPVERNTQFADKFTVNYEIAGCDGHSGECITIDYSNGQFTRTKRFGENSWICDSYPNIDKRAGVLTVCMTIIDHSPPIDLRRSRGVQLLLSDEGDVYSVSQGKVVQRIMVQKRSGKPPLFLK